MRIRALHVLVLSLGAALVGCDAGEGTNDNPADGTVHDGSDGTNPDGSDAATTIMAFAPHGGSDLTFSLDGDPVDPEQCDLTTGSCEIEVNQADGRTYDIGLNMPGFLTVTHQVRVEDTDIGSTFEVDWESEGTYAENFDGWCNLDGNGINLYTTTVEDEAGNEWTVLMGTAAGDAVIVTDTTISGSYNEATFSGDIDTNTGTVTFTYTVNGIDTTLTYDNCTE